MSETLTTIVTELPESRVRVEAEVAPAEVERRMQQAARKLGSQLKIPGFRKGKVPPPVVIRRLGREYVLDEALRDALGAWYVDAIGVAGITPVGEPDINVGDLPDAGSPLAFSIEIGVRPVAKLGKYKGVGVERREPAADEEAIDAEVERLRDRLARLDTVERAAELGDHVVLDYVGKLDGEPFEGGEGRDQLLELGSGRLIPGFEEQLVGAKAGDERLVEVAFPDDYDAEHLAGKPATFDVKVTEVKSKRLPEVDDEFASDAAGFDTLAELHEDIATRLREYEEHTIEHEFERNVLDTIADAATVEVPHQLIHARAHEIVEETMESLARQGISKEMYLQISGQEEEQLAHDAEGEAEKTLRREAVIAAVVEAEKIEPTEADLLEAITSTAERSETTPEKLLKRLESNGRLVRLQAELASRQAVEWLVEHAKPLAPGSGGDKPAAKKRAAKENAAEEPAAKKRAAKEKAAEEPAAKKPASKQPAAKKPASKKAAKQPE
jgi:trigger factor